MHADLPRGRRAFARDAAWALTSTVLAQGGTFACAVLTARLLSREDFGRFALLQTTLLMLGNLGGAGLGATATKYVAELAHASPERTGRVIGLGTAVTAAAGLTLAIMLCAAAGFSARILGISEAAPNLGLGSAFVLFFSINAFHLGALAGLSRFRTLTSIAAVQTVVQIALTVGLTAGFGLSGAVAALSGSALVSCVQHRLALRAACAEHGIPISYRGLRREAAVVARFAMPAAVSGWLGGTAIATATAMLARSAGGLAALALFNVANTLRTAVLVLPNVIVRVATPRLCAMTSAAAASEYRKTLRDTLAINAGTVMSAGAFVTAFAPLVLGVFGPSYAGGRLTVALLMAAALSETLAVVLFQVLFSHGRIWTHVSIQCAWSSLLIGGAWISVKHGAAGLAGAHLAAFTVSAALYGCVARKVLAPATEVDAAAELEVAS